MGTETDYGWLPENDNWIKYVKKSLKSPRIAGGLKVHIPLKHDENYEKNIQLIKDILIKENVGHFKLIENREKLTEAFDSNANGKEIVLYLTLDKTSEEWLKLLQKIESAMQEANMAPHLLQPKGDRVIPGSRYGISYRYEFDIDTPSKKDKYIAVNHINFYRKNFKEFYDKNNEEFARRGIVNGELGPDYNLMKHPDFFQNVALQASQPTIENNIDSISEFKMLVKNMKTHRKTKDSEAIVKYIEELRILYKNHINTIKIVIEPEQIKQYGLTVIDSSKSVIISVSAISELPIEQKYKDQLRAKHLAEFEAVEKKQKNLMAIDDFYKANEIFNNELKKVQQDFKKIQKNPQYKNYTDDQKTLVLNQAAAKISNLEQQYDQAASQFFNQLKTDPLLNTNSLLQKFLHKLKACFKAAITAILPTQVKNPAEDKMKTSAKKNQSNEQVYVSTKNFFDLN